LAYVIYSKDAPINVKSNTPTPTTTAKPHDAPTTIDKVTNNNSSELDELKGKVADEISSEVDKVKGKVADEISSQVSNVANTISSQIGKQLPDVSNLKSVLPDIGKFAKLIPH